MSQSSSYITADPYTLGQILGCKYEVDVFQREYRWGKDNIEHLIEDLTTKFLENYEVREKRGRKDVKMYSKYYMGSIILNVKDGIESIIDGQQRLTSITLLLIYLNNIWRKKDGRSPIESLIVSEAFGEFSLNLQIEDRKECMLKLFQEGENDVNYENESVKNIIERYDDISEIFPEKITGDALPYFVDWLRVNVMFVVIKTWSEDDAYKIFETMNDRGLSLTPPEMLKGYLLSKFSDDNEKKSLNELWKKQISKIKDLNKNADMEFVQSWLRAKYADSMRQPQKDAHDEDFEIIGSKPHSWLKENEQKIGLKNIDDYRNFIQKNFLFYSKIYEKIYHSAHEFNSDMKHVFFIESCGLAHSLYYPLLISPIQLSDNEKIVVEKINLVAKYLESFIIRRKVNYSSISHSNLRISMYKLIKEIRNKSIEELLEIFRKNLDEMKEKLDIVYNYELRKTNKSMIKFILARITSHIEEKSSVPNFSFAKYTKRERKHRFEIEHILANKFSEHQEEYVNEGEFSDYRNRLGCLILIPRRINQSYGALPYKEKLDYYYKENLLAGSLHKNCYERNPGFRKYIEESELPFKSYNSFGKDEIEERQKLYQKICKEIWSSKNFLTSY